VDQFERSNPLNWRLYPLAPSRRGGRGVARLAPLLGKERTAGLAPLLGKQGKGVVVVETLPGRHSSNFKKSTNDARMSLKTKGRCGKLAAETGMYMKTKEIQAESGNLVEKAGS
jgi:hypothetical protein